MIKTKKSGQNLYHTKNNHRPITALWAPAIGRWPGVLILEYQFDMKCNTDFAMFILIVFYLFAQIKYFVGSE